MVISDAEQKIKKQNEVEAALDTALEMYHNRFGFSVKRVRGNGAFFVFLSHSLSVS